jgi:acetyl/propionyl-CoA carboxylase alpha subunit
MKYTLINLERKEKEVFVHSMEEREGVTVLSGEIEGQKYKKLIKEIAGKFFISNDGIKWIKTPMLHSLQSLVSHTELFKVYRAFKPSGLIEAKVGTLMTQMPGKVIKVLVSEGQRVKAGETVVILEAMKMENEIKSGVSGLVKQVAVKTGQVLEAGVILVEIDPQD